MSPPPDSTLVDLQEIVADLKRQLAEAQRQLECRTAERDEAIKHQTATSEVLNVMSRSAFDLQAVLDTLIKTATQLCAAEAAAIAIRDGERGRHVSAYALDDEYYEVLRRGTFVLGPGTVAGRVLIEGRVVHVPDPAADPEYAHPSPLRVEKIRTMLGVPLIRREAVIGAIVLSRQRVEPFTARQIELICTFADQVVIAIENARHGLCTRVRLV